MTRITEILWDSLETVLAGGVVVYFLMTWWVHPAPEDRL